MKTRTLFFVIVVSILLPVSLNAQVGNLVKNKLNKVVNAGVRTIGKEADSEIDTAIQKSAADASEKAESRVQENKQADSQSSDAGEVKSNNEESGAQPGDGFGKLFGNKIDLKYQNEYNFNSRIYMVIETYDKKDVMKMDYFMFYSADNPSVGVETKTISVEDGQSAPVSATMILDGENKSFLMLTFVNGMKMGVISEVPEESANQEESAAKDNKEEVVFTKTGNTREIAGYKCDEYVYKDVEEKETGKVWFSKDSNLKIDRRGWQNSGMSAYYGNPDFNEGVILANETYDDQGKLTMKAETIEINSNFPHSISVDGYTLRQMNMNQSQNQKK